MKKLNIIVIGSGAFGMAIASVYNDSHNVSIFTRDRHKQCNKYHYIKEITDIPDNCFIFIAIPAANMRDICQKIAPMIKPDTVIISAAKGIEESTNLLMTDVINQIIPHTQKAVLSGPNFAKEMMLNLPAIATLASANAHHAKWLSTDNFVLYHSDDLVGVQLYGALKNVLAIFCGIGVGLELGENFKAAAITRGINEISKLVIASGGKNETILTPAAIGDLFLTCNSTTSRNMKLGTKIAINGSYQENLTSDHVEGITTIRSLRKMLSNSKLDLPILHYICALVIDGIKIDRNQFISTVL